MCYIWSHECRQCSHIQNIKTFTVPASATFFGILSPKNMLDHAPSIYHFHFHCMFATLRQIPPPSSSIPYTERSVCWDCPSGVASPEWFIVFQGCSCSLCTAVPTPPALLPPPPDKRTERERGGDRGERERELPPLGHHCTVYCAACK